MGLTRAHRLDTSLHAHALDFDRGQSTAAAASHC